MTTYHHSQDTLRWQEAHLYGSSRLGMQVIDDRFWTSAVSRPDTLYPICTGCKRYEITNHLGNVMTVINDRKTPVPKASPKDDEAEYFMPTILMKMDYFPFGMKLFEPATLGDYRFGFGGHEKGYDNDRVNRRMTREIKKLNTKHSRLYYI